MSELQVSLKDEFLDEYSLEFIEKELFYAYDAAYSEYVNSDGEFVRDNARQELRAYKDALETITHLRNRIEDSQQTQLDTTESIVSSSV